MNKNNTSIFRSPIIIFIIILFSPLLIGYSCQNQGIKNVELQIEELNSLYSQLKDEEISRSELTSPSVSKTEHLPFTGFIQYQNNDLDDSNYYYYSTPSLSVTFRVSEVSFIFGNLEESEPVEFSLNFLNSEKVKPIGVKQTSYPTYYFDSKDQPNILKSWKEIWYHDLYPGIDLRYYMTVEGLKYDFIINPGGNPDHIAIKVSDSMSLDIEKSGVSFKSNKVASMDKIQDTALKVFQEDGIEISADFIPLKNSVNSYGFKLGSYNQAEILIVDPLFLEYGTFLGGSHHDSGGSIVVDSSENCYITGSTRSPDFPTLNAYNDTSDGSTTWNDVFVAKLNATGNGLEFSTYIGGKSTEYGQYIAIDAEKNIYIAGATASNNFPTKNAYDSTYNGGQDVFLLKLNATGNGLEFSTFFGAGSTDSVGGMVLDKQGNIIIGGSTFGGIPMVNGYNSTFGGYTDVFVAKFNNTGNGIIFSTYIGGTESEFISNLILDSQGNIYIAGTTGSSEFPTVNAYDNSYNGDVCDGFVAKLGSDGDQLLMSTYLGGSDWDYTTGIALDSVGNIYITGRTRSSNFPIKTPYQSSLGGMYDVYFLKLKNDDYSLIFSTFLGGFENDIVNDLIMNDDESCLILGMTESSDFPLVNPYQDFYAGNREVFITEFDPSGQKITYSTYLGGENDDNPSDIALDTQNNIYIIGTTDSRTFPTKNAFNNTLGETAFGTPTDDVFLTKFIIDTDEPLIELNNPINESNQQSHSAISFTITDSSSGIENVLYNWDETTNNTVISEYELTVPSGEGYHVLHMFVQDQAGNWARKMFIFHTDDTAPMIASYGDIPNDQTPTALALMWTIGDEYLDSYYIYANGTLVDFSFGINQTIVDILLPVEGVNILPGVYNFTLVAFDSAGNSASNTQIIVITGIGGVNNATNTPGFEVLPLIMVFIIVVYYRTRIFSTRKKK